MKQLAAADDFGSRSEIGNNASVTDTVNGVRLEHRGFRQSPKVRTHPTAHIRSISPKTEAVTRRVPANQRIIRIRGRTLESDGSFMALTGLQKLSAFCRDFTAT